MIPFEAFPKIPRLKREIRPPEAATKCHLRIYPTQAEVEADEREWNRRMALIFDENKSACCEAPLDESRVDEHGTGPRYCSACKTLVFQGCARVGEESLDEGDDPELATQRRGEAK